MSSESRLGGEGDEGTEWVSPASDTLLSTVETPDFGRYDLVARDADDGSGEWHFGVRSGRGVPKNDLRFVWDFGDGTTLEGVEQTYAFTNNGSYVVKVRAIKVDGTVAFVLTLNIEVALVINTPPIADAGANQTVQANALVFLYSGASSDPDGDPLTYQWVQISGEPALLLHADEPTASFIAPSIPNDSDLVFGVTVSDGGYNEQDTVVVRVLRLVQPAETLVVTADAGADQLNVLQGTAVTLDGSGSRASDSRALAYAWSQTSGPTVALRNAQQESAAFTAPSATEGTSTELLFELVVTAADQSAADSVRVTVVPDPITPGTNPQATDLCTVDTDGDGVNDCNDRCPGEPDIDANGDGIPDCMQPPGELLLLHFDGNAQDASANAADGSWIGSERYATDGVVGQAAWFDGSNYVAINETSGLAVTDQLTVAAWVRFDTLSPSASYSTILDTTVGTSPRTGYSFFFRKADRVVRMELWNAGQVVFSIDSATTTWPVNAWQHVAVVFDSSRRLEGGHAGRLYVNGALDASSAWGGGVLSGVGPTAVVGRYLVGDLDELAVWGRALTATDIQQLAQVTPSSDTQPPTVSISVPANNTTVSGASVTLSATASDNVGVAGVQFKLDGATLGTEDTTSPYSIVWNTTHTTNGAHTLTATARDTSNLTTNSAPITVTVNNTATNPDTTAPTVPTNLTATSVSSSQINLSWSASTDPTVTGQATSGVTGYKVYRNGSATPLATVTTISYPNTGLSPSTTYTYQVLAIDGATNESAKSTGVSPTTLPQPSGAITAQITPSRTTCMAPCAIFFEGTDSTDANGNKIGDSNGGQGLLGNDIVEYTWDFGDGSTFSGFNAAHVYEPAGSAGPNGEPSGAGGTYQVRLTVRDKNNQSASGTQAITVLPFSGTTYYVRADGNDANAGTGSSAAQAWKTYNKAFSAISNNSIVRPGSRVLFKRGDTFPYTTSVHLGSAQNVVIGAYGTGERPLFQYTGTTGADSAALIQSYTQASAISVMDIRLNGKSGAVYAHGVSTWMTNLLLLRVALDQTANNVFYTDGLFMVSSTINGLRNMFYEGSRLAIINSEIGPATETHNLYGSAIDRGVIAGNLFQTAWWGGVRIAANAAPGSWNIVVSDNEFFNLPSPLDVKVTSGSSTPWRGQNVLIERNYVHDCGHGIRVQKAGYRQFLARNNVFTNVPYAVALLDFGAAGILEGIDGFRFYNNTIVASGDSTVAVLIQTADHVGVECRNNVFVMPSASTSARVLKIEKAGAEEQVAFDRNLLFFSDPRFDGTQPIVSVAGVNYTTVEWNTLGNGSLRNAYGSPLFDPSSQFGLGLLQGSPAINSGETLERVYEDFSTPAVRRLREAYDIGAIEKP